MQDPYGYNNTIAKAASRARGDRLGPLYKLCDGQKTVSTLKLYRLVNALHDSDQLDAIHFRDLADKISPHRIKRG